MARNKTPGNQSRSESVEAEREKLRVFISYSRRDAALADRVAAELIQRGFEPIIDRRDLPYGEQWQVELATLIQSSDTVVWLVSVQSVASAWVNWELGQVARASKRLIPVRIEEIAPESLPQSIGRIHLLPSEGVFDVDRHSADLAAALESDRAWIRQSTRLADRAAEWKLDGARRDLLLRGAALQDAETWRKRQPVKAPPPSADIQELLAASERAGKQRARRLLAVSTLIAAGSAALALVATTQYLQAESARVEAVKQRDQALLSESQFIAEKADKRLSQWDSIGALTEVRAALPQDLNAPNRPLSDDAMVVLASALYASPDNPFRRFEYHIQGHATPPDRPAFSVSPDGRYVAFSAGSGLEVWDVTSRRQILNKPSWRDSSTFVRGLDVSVVPTLLWSHNGKALASMSGDDWGAISIWTISSGERTRLAIPGCPQDEKSKTELSIEEDRRCRVQEAAWSPDDNNIAVSVFGGLIHVFDLTKLGETRHLDVPCETPAELTFGNCSARDLNWSNDGALLGSRYNDDILRVVDWRSNTEVFRRPQVSRASFESGGLRIKDTNGTSELLIGPKFEKAVGAESGTASPSGDRVATFVDGAIEIRQSTGEEPVTKIPSVARFDRLSWSPDGTVIATLYGGIVLMFDASSGRRLFRLGDTNISVSGFAWTARPGEFAIAFCQQPSCSMWGVVDMAVERDPALLLDGADKVIRAPRPKN